MDIGSFQEKTKSLKILSIDGGGVRGIIPARILSKAEKFLQEQNEGKKLWECFDIITGTSTGGIIALAVALGIPASKIEDIYLTESRNIFGSKKGILGQWFYSAHDSIDLKRIIKELFAQYNNGIDPVIGNCKTQVAIPIYDLYKGKPRVLKSKYHSSFNRDYHIPAYMAAMATSAAPTFFEPYSNRYRDDKSVTNDFFHKIDGGLFANNPSLGCLIEVQRSFNVKLENIKMLSLGTGHYKFYDAIHRKNYGLAYWLKNKRIIEIFLQAQSQEVENLISLLNKGIGKADPERFTYLRVDAEMDVKDKVPLDETRPSKLSILPIIGDQLWEKHMDQIVSVFLN